MSVEIRAHDTLLRSSVLPAYYRNNSIETEEIVLPLDKPAQEYQITVTDHTIPLKTWHLKGVHSSKPYLLFDEGAGRVIRHDTPTTLRFWLVFHERYQLRDETCVIEEGDELYGEWNTYRSYLIDASQHYEILLDSSDGKTIVISVQNLGPILFDGKKLRISSSEKGKSLPVYIGVPPNIRIPITAKPNKQIAKLKTISVKIFRG